jgi:hypothetical protein
MAHHQPLARAVRQGDLGQVLLVQQRQLQRTLLDQLANRLVGQRRDPAQATMLLQLVNLRRRQQAPILNHRHSLQPKPPLSLTFCANPVIPVLLSCLFPAESSNESNEDSRSLRLSS